MTYIEESQRYLANASPVEGMIWVWIDANTWTVEQAEIEGSYPAVANPWVETKLEYLPAMRALVWVNLADEDIRIIRFE